MFRWSACWRASLALLTGLVAPTSHALAEGPTYFNLILENNSTIGSSDKHYTHGTLVSYLSSEIDPQQPSLYRWLSESLSFLPVFQHQGTRSRAHWFAEAGQSIFTPENKDLSDPDPNDRPYAGWLYASFGYLRDTDSRVLDYLQLTVGVVGPHAYGEETQDTFHDIFGVGHGDIQGWDHQLHDEPGFVVSIGRKWRESRPIGAGFSADIIPQVNASLGNVFTYGAVGALLRIGRNTGFDYGPPRIMPGLSGTNYFDTSYLSGTDSGWGWYLFVGGEARVVAHNIFLDGNTFRDSSEVDKNVLVGDVQIGLAVAIGTAARLTFSYIWRSEEFETQRGADKFGSVNFALRF